MNLPPAADCRWAQLDHDPNTILENTLKGDVAKKIKTIVEIVNQACHDTFSTKEDKTLQPPAWPNRTETVADKRSTRRIKDKKNGNG